MALYYNGQKINDVAIFSGNTSGEGGGGECNLTQFEMYFEENGNYNFKASDYGADGFEDVTIEINVPANGAVGELTTDWSAIGYQSIPADIDMGYNYAKQIYDNWDPSDTNFVNRFMGDGNLRYFPLVDTSNVGIMTRAFSASNIKYIPNELDVHNVQTFEEMFSYCNGLESIDLSGWNTASLKIGSGLFKQCNNIKTINLDNWDVTKMSSMYEMFQSCHNLTSVSFDGWVTSNLKDLQYTFNNCSGLTSLNLSHFDVSNVTNMNSTFRDCSALKELNISNWNTSAVTSMTNLFDGCKTITSLDLSNWDTSKVQNFNAIFGCSNLAQVIGSIDLQSVTASTINKYYFPAYAQRSAMREITFKNIGHNALNSNSSVSIDFTYFPNWGVNTEDIPNARLSLVNSLITYSYDRAAGGHSTCTITLSPATKNVLTDEEIALITAKGYTLA